MCLLAPEVCRPPNRVLRLIGMSDMQCYRNGPLGHPVVPNSTSLPFEGMVGILWRRGIDGLTAVAAPSLAATLAH